MPVGYFSLGSRLVEGTTNQSTHDLQLYFNRDDLLKEYDWGAQLENEIRNLSDKIEINPHLKAMMNRIHAINLVMLEEDITEIKGSAQVVNELVNEAARSGDGTPTILYFKKSTLNPLGATATLEAIPLHIIGVLTQVESSEFGISGRFALTKVDSYRNT